MAARKTTRAKGKTSRKTKPRRKSSSEFPCPNPDRALSLEAIVRRMQKDASFAQFIGDLLCDSYSEDKAKAKAAQECLSSYYDPTSDELSALCVPKNYQRLYATCTVPTNNLLIVVPADLFARQRA